jgi:CheY-like chemotaxis protein
MRKINTLCLIDDDSVYQFLTTKVISETKLVDLVKVFSNGLEAIDFFKSVEDEREKLPDVILLDLTMPIMDGWDFLEEYVKLQPTFKKKITLYIVSSSIAPSDMIRARSIGAVSDFIVKPITKDKFLSILKGMA